MDNVTSNMKETKPDILCNCRKYRCVQHGCRCFAAKLYCDDGCRCDYCLNKLNSTGSSSARHKKGCRCLKIKCRNKSCVCYRDKVGCSKRCRCRDCTNSFGKKPEPMLLGAEYWKNRSRKMPCSSAVASITKFHEYWSALSPDEEPCPSKDVLDESLSISETIGDDLNRLFSISNNREMTRYEMDDIRGDDLKRLFSISNNREMTGYEMDDILGDDLKRLFSMDDMINEMFEDDDKPDIIMEDSNPTNTMKSESACQPTPTTCCNTDIIMEDSNPTNTMNESACRPTPTTCCNTDIIMEDSNTMKSESDSQPTAASMPCSTTPTTCCNTEDRTSQTEIHHDK